jgi:hypothetical protein
VGRRWTKAGGDGRRRVGPLHTDLTNEIELKGGSSDEGGGVRVLECSMLACTQWEHAAAAGGDQRRAPEEARKGTDMRAPIDF